MGIIDLEVKTCFYVFAISYPVFPTLKTRFRNGFYPMGNQDQYVRNVDNLGMFYSQNRHLR